MFPGTHKEDDNHTVILFDVNLYKKGLLSPSKFIEHFGHLKIPNILFEGNVNVAVYHKVKHSKLKGMTFEGVVFKGENEKIPAMLIMFKVKSQAWLDKLKTYCKDDLQLFMKLS